MVLERGGARAAVPAARAGAGERSAADAVAPWLFVLLWSTGFVGAKYGLPYAGPFTFLGVRLAIAAVLLAALAVLAGAPGPGGATGWRHAAVAGLLLHAGYLGGVFLAISVGVPAGVSSVIVSLQPVLTAVLAARLLGEALRRVQVAGLVLGVVGVVLVLSPGLAAAAGADSALPPLGLAACGVALLATTAGTLYQKRYGGGVPLLSGTAVQYAASSAVLLAAAVATGDRAISWTPEFVAAMAWLVLALSLGAVLLLLTLLRRGTVARVSSLFYLVPPATAVEAYLLFGERLTPLALLGLAVTAAGVALVLRPARP